MEAKLLLDPVEVAERLELPRATIYVLLRQNLLRGYKHKSRWLVPETEVRRFKEEFDKQDESRVLDSVPVATPS